MKNNNLTIRQLKFVEEYVKNQFNGSLSYRIAFGTDNHKVSTVEASKLLKLPKIQDAIEATEQSYRHLAREMRLDRRSILLEIKNVIKNGKPMERLSAIKLLCTLKGDFKPIKQVIDFSCNTKIDTTKMSEAELRELRDQLFSEM